MAMVVEVHSQDDPRLAGYTRLKERDLSREGGRFTAESEKVVRRLLQAGTYRVESVLCIDRKVESLLPLVPETTPVYVAGAALVNSIVGFKFHSGVMAIGYRGQPPSLADVAGGWGDGAVNLLILPEVNKTDNLGALIRIAAGFGASAVVLGERCCDPFYRQAIRVSMGTVFRLPIVRSDNLLRDLALLRDRFGVELVASMLDETAEPLASALRRRRTGLLFGNEALGLSEAEAAACSRRVMIPMSLGTDSLNVSVAAGVFLYHFTQVAQEAPADR